MSEIEQSKSTEDYPELIIVTVGDKSMLREELPTLGSGMIAGLTIDHAFGGQTATYCKKARAYKPNICITCITAGIAKKFECPIAQDPKQEQVKE